MRKSMLRALIGGAPTGMTNAFTTLSTGAMWCRPPSRRLNVVGLYTNILARSITWAQIEYFSRQERIHWEATCAATSSIPVPRNPGARCV